MPRKKKETKRKSSKKEVVTDLYRDEPLYPNQELNITLEVPISVNSMYMPFVKGRKKGGKHLTKDAERWIQRARIACMEAIERQGWQEDKPDVWYVVETRFYFADRRIRDSHNGFKILMDAMEGVVYHNDYFCLIRTMSVKYDKTNPRVEVRIYPLKDIEMSIET